MPPEVAGGDLGLPPEEMARHIAYDIGARGRDVELARLLDAPALLTRFSRLVIDPNRGEDDPTLVMRLYDGTIIPANRARRAAPRSSGGSTPTTGPIIAAIDAAIDRMLAAGPRAGAGRDPLVHAAAAGPRRRGPGRSASSGTTTAASRCR